ncbi:hypothetical protein NC239_23220 [Streptomyces sp. G3]|uniref:hypothetical protein n=1 Tax=Streptomyces sp. G3 TaxID=690144 RepID=UPI002030A321|nr:hypothetical protein [Streptomyces sp. G3]MCM1941115.1 hypothetical protein [Streptomyces sp. G3]
MINFMIGVLSSLVATWAGLAAAFLWSGRFRWFLVTALSRLSGGDFGQSWDNKAEAEADFNREIRRARKVDLFTGRGNELQRATFSSLLMQRPGSAPRPHFRILLPHTGVGTEAQWTRDRESEIASFDRSFGTGQLHRQIETNVAHLAPYNDDGTVETRRYDFPHLGRICITDQAAYFTPYLPDEHGRDSKVLKYTASSPMYHALARLFQKLWEGPS